MTTPPTDRELADLAWHEFIQADRPWSAVANYSPARLAKTHWGKGKAYLDMIGRNVVVPPAVPSPPTAVDEYLIQYFTDTQTTFGKNLINRWQTPFVGSDPFSAPGDTGTPWPSGGGVFEVSTPYGPGFKMIATPEMEVASGGKKAEIADIGHLVLRHGMGSTQEFQGHFMFPSAGNTSGFVRNYPDWSTFWNLHGTTTTDIAHMGINTTDAPFTNNIFFSRSGPTVDKVTAAANVVYDQWYSYRVSVKYSTTSDGLLQFWLDGVQLADWPGATVPVGDNPYLQYGFYADIFFSNEVRHGGMKVIG